MAPAQVVGAQVAKARARAVPADSPFGSPAGSRGQRDDGMQGKASPRARGALAKSYESRNGSPDLVEDKPGSSVAAPRAAKKPGVGTFTDARNPFARRPSKQIVRVDEVRGENDRAGCRTRNPGMIACEQGAADRASSEDGRGRAAKLVAHRYSTASDWRPSKRGPDAPGAPSARSPRCSEGVASLLSSRGDRGAQPRVLENYLNDMKRCSAAVRQVPAAPSAELQKMNDDRYALPAERSIERGLAPRRSLSCDSRRQNDTDQESTYGFQRKREVKEPWSRSGGQLNMLQHAAPSGDLPSTPRRRERLQRTADERFAEVVAHMKAENPAQRQRFEHFRAKSQQSLGLLEHKLEP